MFRGIGISGLANCWPEIPILFGLFKRRCWDTRSPTVLTNFHNPRLFLHPEANRPFSQRECARLQTFPDSFELEAAGVRLVEAYRLVGNAVAPRVAGTVAGAVEAFLARLEISAGARSALAQ